MGWTSYHANEYKHGTIDRKAECDKLYNWEDETHICRVLKSRMIGSTYYAAVERTEKGNGFTSVIAVITLTKVDIKDWFNFSYKCMDETFEPFYYDCPKSIINLLTPTENEHAIKWRKKCREKLEEIKLKDLPVGTIIKWKVNGEEIIVTKNAPNFQFKKCWYGTDYGTYVPVTRIKTFEVIKKGEY